MINLNGEQARGGTLCLSKAGLAIGSTKTGVAVAAPNGAGVDFGVDGKLYHAADAATDAVTAGQSIAAGYTAILLVCMSAASTPVLTTVLGRAAANADVTAGVDVIDYPAPTAGTCPIGALKVKNASSSAFVTGTTDFDATDITTTYIDLLAPPTTPETS